MNIEPIYWQIPINHHLETNLASKKKSALIYKRSASFTLYDMCGTYPAINRGGRAHSTSKHLTQYMQIYQIQKPSASAIASLFTDILWPLRYRRTHIFVRSLPSNTAIYKKKIKKRIKKKTHNLIRMWNCSYIIQSATPLKRSVCVTHLLPKTHKSN